MLKYHLHQITLIILLSSLSSMVFAKPREVSGRLFFLGVSNDSSRSVWLSLTTAGSFKLEAQGQQLIDEWALSSRGSHLSLSPVVSQGNGGTHFLINAANNKKLDSQNQRGGTVFPPFPAEPPIVTNPIPPIPGHPIFIPPVGVPPIVAPPIVIPPGSTQPPGAINPPGITTPPISASGNQMPQSPAATPTQEKKQDSQKKAPLTEARQFDQESKWNIWSDNRYFDLNDSRHDIDAKGYTTNFTVGADRLITSKTTVGFLLSSLKYRNQALDGLLKNRVCGFNVGPYLATNLTQKWSIDGAFTYGQLKNNNELAILKSDYKTQLLSASLHAIGLYTVGAFQFLPKPLISYTHFRNPKYQLHGVLQDIPIQINRAEDTFNFGYLELRVEGNYSTQSKNGNIFQPYAEVGIDYVFAQPNGGKMLTSDLTLAAISKYTGTAMLGMRALLAKAFLIDLSGGYISIGQHGLDAWELKALAAYSFN